MLTVHHLNNSRSQRILWLLEELGIDYQVKRYERDPVTNLAPDSLRAIHPLGKSPVITDDEQVIAESGAIMEYLLDKYDDGKLGAKRGTPEALRLTYWLHYAEGSAMPPLLLSLIFSKVANAPAPFFVRPIAKAIAAKVNAAFIGPQLRLHFDYLEQELNKSQWLIGNRFSAADIQMSFPIEAAQAREVIGSQHPKLLNFLKQIHARPAYQRALEKGGPYDLLR